VSSTSTPPAKVEYLKSLRASLLPEHSYKTLDELAKWLFSVAAIVGSLGIAFGTQGFGDLEGWPRRVFAVAVASLGISLAAAMVSLVPKRLHPNPNSSDSILAEWKRVLNHRARWLRAAMGLLALALVTAALIPLSSDNEPDAMPTSFSYVVDGDRHLSAKFVVSDAEPFTPVTVLVRASGKHPGLPKTRGLTDADGVAALSIDLKDPGRVQTIHLVGTWSPEGEALAIHRERTSVRLGSPRAVAGQRTSRQRKATTRAKTKRVAAA